MICAADFLKNLEIFGVPYGGSGGMLGTMAYQNANSVAITGGSANFIGGDLQYTYTYTDLVGDYSLLHSNSNEAFNLTVSPLDVSDGLGVATFEPGFIFVLKNTSAGNTTFTPKLGETIDGQASLTIAPGDSYMIMATPTEWSIVAASTPSTFDAYLPLAGGTMSGSINMGNFNIDNLAAIRSTAGANILTFTYQGSAVNYLNVQNTPAGGNPPQIIAMGSDATVPFALGSKGAYIHIFDNTGTLGGETRWFNAASTQYTGFYVSPAQAVSLRMQLPSVDGSAGAYLQTSGAGVLTFKNPNYQISASSGTFSGGAGVQSDVTNLSVTITTTGRPVMLMTQDDSSGNPSFFSPAPTAGATGVLYFVRGATTLTATQITNPASSAFTVPPIYTFLDTPAAGTYTYKLQYNNTVGNFLIYRTKLVAYEM